MEVTYLGLQPSAGDPDSWSGVLLASHDGLILLDCGGSVTADLAHRDIPIEKIDTVLFSGLRAAHVAGFGPFALSAWRHGRREPLTVYGPTGIDRIIEATRALYAADIHHALTTERLDSNGIRWDVHEVDSGPVFVSRHLEITAAAAASTTSATLLDYHLKDADERLTLSGHD